MEDKAIQFMSRMQELQYFKLEGNCIIRRISNCEPGVDCIYTYIYPDEWIKSILKNELN